MTEVSVHDVAKYILEKTGRIQAIKLQKLCYFAQGWSMAWLNEPLFKDEIRAWKYGPVVYELYRFHRGETHVDSWDYEDADAMELSDRQRKLVDAVIRMNAHRSGFDLVRETHKHDIWIDKYKNADPDDRGRKVLYEEDIRKEFERLDDELIKATS